MTEYTYIPGAELEEDEVLSELDSEARLGALEPEMGEEATEPPTVRVATTFDRWASTAFFSAALSTCLKQKVVALIVSEDDKLVGVGWNGSRDRPPSCPRILLETGTRYDLCDSTCPGQQHAERAAIQDAGLARGTIMYVAGHTYCCNDCLEAMREYGIEEVRMVATG